MNKEDDKKDYEIGYKRPPKANQFKKGQSGNPKGRPKLVKSFKADLKEELEEIISINEGGKAKLATKQRGLIKRILTAALNGNNQAAKISIGMISSLFEPTEEPDEEISPEDLELLKKYYGGIIDGNN
jgi:hypothetical protein